MESFTQSYTYDGDDEREIPDARLIVKPGDTFEITDPAVAKGLDGQPAFKKVTAKAPKTETAAKGAGA